MIKVHLSDGTTRWVTAIEYDELRASMIKTGDYREGESRSDFDMTKKANIEILGAESFFVAGEKADKTIIGNITMGSVPDMPKEANRGGDKWN